MATTLQALISGRGGSGGAAAGRAGAKSGGAAAGASSVDVFEGRVSVTAHKATNALVITSSSHDFAALRPVIDTLDIERKQVFIEAVIMELSVDRSRNFGVAFHGGIPNLAGKDSVSVLGFRAANTIGGLQGMAANGEVLSGLAVGVQGPVIANSQQLVGLSLPGFGVAVNALASSGDANILSTPHLIATDNVEASISVGQNVPLQTSGASPLGALGGLGALGAQSGVAGALGGAGGLGALGGLGGFAGAVPRQDVGTTVTITPHMNESSEIRLQIQQEISSAGAPSKDGALGVVSIDRTKAKTEVVVRDQQTVVIGGLMRDQVTTAETKVPVLGDIPLIGALFRSSNKRKVKKNLLLFLTPYIIRSPDDLRSIYERKMRERQEFLDRYFVFSEAEYEPPLDYSRTRGLVGEIMIELKHLDEKQKMAADAAKHPELGHKPSPSVGEGGGPAPDQLIEPGGPGGPSAGPGPVPEAGGQEAAPPPEPPPQVEDASPPPPAEPPPIEVQ
jgi:general secretion pathway protein D